MRHRIRIATRRLKYLVRRRIRSAWAARRITRVDQRPIPDTADELRMFVVARNESLRLPFLLDSYFSRGVDRVFLVDNDSTDNMATLAMQWPNVHLFHTPDQYVNQGYWIDSMLRRYGAGGWNLVVDADEYLIYPDYESLGLRALCSRLDKSGFNALDTVLLDMYPMGPIGSRIYKSGDNPLDIADHFDRGPYDDVADAPIDLPETNIYYRGPDRLLGGMRHRVFGIRPCISKFPLVRFQPGMFLGRGAHFMDGARIAPMRGALLHFKYLHDFEANARVEASRGAHWRNATEYKAYVGKFEDQAGLSLYGDVSEKFRDSAQLVELGIMRP